MSLKNTGSPPEPPAGPAIAWSVLALPLTLIVYTSVAGAGDAARALAAALAGGA